MIERPRADVGRAISKADKPAVLFLCVKNGGKSQMALGWFKELAGDRAIYWSGGSEPGKSLSATAVEAMTERGIDITGEFPKPWTDERIRMADVVVTMGCGDTCPYYPGTRYEDWSFEVPEGLDGLEANRNVRDQIEAKVRRLLAELGVEVAPDAVSR